ncbi:MAG TPA: DNA cytosine methyltransferase [Solirubrobacterales bacterium]
MSATVTDLFCGAGGSSLGAEMAGGSLRLALNHWDRAIETHASNFQNAEHDCNDISALTTAQIRRYPDSDILLASPECTNHSLAKGALRRKPQASSLFEDGPAGDAEQERSRATMWDVCRFAEQKLLRGHPYKGIVVENVPDAFWWGPEAPGYKQGDGSLFDAWLTAMRALGYEHQIVWLNSMFAGAGIEGRGVPQSRDRMYVVFWLRTMRSPDLRIEPLSWCPECEALVAGQQSFKARSLKKSGGRPWGCYGRQYVFTCPACSGTVFPGAHPAAEAIDWSLPIGLIGEREKPLKASTRARIRRGLEKVSNEPFGLRTGGTGNPRPLTLPLITLTARHEAAMVVPTAGNTFERTPGNRARDASRRPLDTVHGTLDRAMIVPPMGEAPARDAGAVPGPTQTTSTRPALVVTAGGTWSGSPTDTDREPLSTQTATESKALVMANTENNVPRPAGREPAQTLRTEGGLALVGSAGKNGAATDPNAAMVMRNNSGGGEMSTPVGEPIRTLTGGGHQSLVIPYYRTGRATPARENPTPTVSTRDRLALVVPFTRNGRSRIAGRDVIPTLTVEGPPGLAVTDDDIDGCRFRMFALHEIASAMAMRHHADGAEYRVLGNKRERMQQYGNAVTPPAMELLVSRLLDVLS